jgi:transposase
MSEQQPLQQPAPAAPSPRFRVPERKQMEMRYDCLDERLPADHPARTVWSVVSALDLSAFAAGVKAVAGGPGRDATDPTLLVALWLYAATDGVGSARELERLCGSEDAYRWLCGRVSVNHHTLGDFRAGHADALDGLFTQVIAALVDKKLVTVHRVATDGTRVRACAGSDSFRREDRLVELLGQAQKHVAELRARLDDPAHSAGLSARQKAAQERAAREREQRCAAAVETVREMAQGRRKDYKAPRASTTDAQVRVMKMPNGGFNPAVNVQVSVDAASRAIVAVDVTDAGSDAGLAPAAREQVQRRTGLVVQEHLIDGGFLDLDEVEADGPPVLFVPPKPVKDKTKRSSPYEPLPGDSQRVKDWRARMGGPEGKAAYKDRASTVETANAELKTLRGLVQLTVRGLAKARCVALWSAMAYNVAHFAAALLA